MIYLQCCDHIAVNDYTLHLLCHYAGIECRDRLQKVRAEVLPDFLRVQQNYDWFKAVMADLLGKKGMDHEEYLVKILKGLIPFDEGAILLFARATGHHFAVILGDEFWCTNYDNESDKWTGILLYAGNLKFVDTIAGQLDREDCYELLNLNAFGKPHGSATDSNKVLSPTHSSETSVVVESETSDEPVKTDSDDEYLPPAKRRRKKSSSRVRELLATVRKPVKKRPRKKPAKVSNPHKDAILFNVADPPARSTRSAKKRQADTNNKPDAITSDKSTTVNGTSADKSSDPTPTKSDKSTTVNGSSADKSTDPQPTKSDKSTNVNGSSADKSSDPQPTKSDKSTTANGSSADKSSDPQPTKSDKSTPLPDQVQPQQSDKSDGEAEKSNTEADKSGNLSDSSTIVDATPANNNDATPVNAAAPLGVLNVQVHGLKRTVVKERKHKCPNCDEVFKLIK